MNIALDSTNGAIPVSFNIKNKKKFTGYTVKYQLSNVGLQCVKVLKPYSKNSFHTIGLFAASGSAIHFILYLDVKNIVMTHDKKKRRRKRNQSIFCFL